MRGFETEPVASGGAAHKARGHPRRISPARLERIALHYLGRYASSAAHLRQVLLRRAQRAAEFHDQDMREVAAWIDDLIVCFVEKNYVNDRSFAESEIRRLRRRGNSTVRIRAHLRAKGVSSELSDELLADEDADAEWQAACGYARRRRLGPYRVDPTRRAQSRVKDLAALARAGFGRDVAERVIDSVSPEE